MSERTRWQVYLLALLAVIGIFQIATLRAGHRWGDDFAAFILQTIHMASGHGFVPYEFIPNPETQLGGQAYPPVTSVLLLPVYWLFGLSLTPMKITGVICFLGALWFIYLIFEDRLPHAWRIVLVALVGFNPTLYETRNDIESTRPFLLVLFLCFYLIRRAYRRAPEEKPPLLDAVWVGAAIFAACATRNVGLALFPTLLFLDLYLYRRMTRFAIAALTIAAIPSLLVSHFLKVTGGYGQLYDFSPRWLIHSFFVFSTHIQRAWWAGRPRMIAYGVGVVALLLALWGVRVVLKRRLEATELFIPFYLGVVLPYFAPWYYPYFFPLIPLFFGYMLIGIRDLAGHWPRHVERPLLAAACAVVLFLYGTDIARAGYGPFREGIGDPEFLQACDYIRKNTAPSAVILFRKPRLLALLTGRSCAVYTMHLDRPTEPIENWDWAQKIHARYLLVPFVPDPDVNGPNQDLMRFVDQYQSQIRLVYQTGHFKLYQIG